MSSSPDISEKLRTLRARIGEAAVRSGRKPEEVALLAVTKTFPVEALRDAYDAGLRDFGENRVQEALGKIASLPLDIRWHLIGRLQSNKINKVMGKFALLQSIDSIELGRALSARLEGKVQDILLEVNTSGEESKAGVRPSEASSTGEELSQMPGLRLKGLMTVGPLTQDEGRQREAFKKLKGLFEEMRRKAGTGGSFSILSMGMSGDFESAIEQGSTMVRIGSALFGERA